jgi:hypothetical protein
MVEGWNVIVIDEKRTIRFNQTYGCVNAVDVCMCMGMTLEESRNHVNNPFILKYVFPLPGKTQWGNDWTLYWRHVILFITELGKFFHVLLKTH